MAQTTAHVIAHTHWDREWYMPFVVFNTSGWERSGAASIEIDVKRLPLGDFLHDIAPDQA